MKGRIPVVGEQMILSEARNRLTYLLHQFEKRGSPAIVSGQTHRTIRALDKLRFFLDRNIRTKEKARWDDPSLADENVAQQGGDHVRM